MTNNDSIGYVTKVAHFSETGWTTIISGYRERIGENPATVELKINGFSIRRQRAERSISKVSDGNEFEFYVSQRLLSLLPPKSEIEILDDDTGQSLHFSDGIDTTVKGTAEDGGNKLRAMLDGEYHLDHWGDIHKSFGKAPYLKQKFVNFYAVWRDFFEENLGTHIFMIGGNLLGIIREGDFLDNDDDLDVAIGLLADTPEAAADAFFAFYDQIVPLVKEQGSDIRLLTTGHFQIIQDGMVLDTFASWITSDGKYYRMIGTGGEYGATRHNCQKIQFRGEDVYIPEFPERELELSYGPEWSSPDPDFVWNIDAEIKDYIEKFKKYGWKRFKERSK